MKLNALFLTAAAVASLAAPAARAEISVIWANDGGDKVVQEECRASAPAQLPRNSVWDGSKVKLFAAKNEVVSFNLVIEAAVQAAESVSVKLSQLTGPGGAVISSQAADGDGVFDWTERNIELFFVRYLKIEGLSSFSYQTYDERHIPKKLQRPWTADGQGTGKWTDRPNADKSYPEIAVPYELVKQFDIARGQNQSIWADIYVPRFTPAGVYRGVVHVTEDGKRLAQIPVELTVRDFALPEVPSSKTMVYLGYEDLGNRYFGKSRLKADSPAEKQMQLIRDRHFQVAHRHKLSLIDRDPGASQWTHDSPRYEWISRLDGTLFSPLRGYEGPGAYTGNGIYAVGAYDSWGWKRDDDEQVMHQHADGWSKWFARYFPGTEYFLYLIDESSDFIETEKWAKWLKSNPGPGRAMQSFATIPLPEAQEHVPDLDISASWLAVGDKPVWDKALATAKADATKKFYAYNGKRPASGSFATEDDGVALRELPWGQYKKGVDRWFFWESTYYADYQTGRGLNDLFHDARTIGQFTVTDPSHGKSGFNYSNGDGVLFYPGTDKAYPDDSYNINGPIASLRIKHWRRGIQDVDYLTLASRVAPDRVRAIVEKMVPKVLWENGIADPKDPTYVRTDISWSTDPDVWEAARAQLADIIEGKPAAAPVK
ncbi:MAG: DUF4091 domain-containing protein [Deltaproteobacteria bacterium]|nr:DUF4091 domain-containing protein [Deltaproteobacteria bacterium]